MSFDSQATQTLDVRRSRLAFVLRWLVYAVGVAAIVVLPPMLAVSWRREPAAFTGLIQLGGLFVAVAILLLMSLGAYVATLLPGARAQFSAPVLRIGPDGLTLRRRVVPPVVPALDQPDAEPEVAAETAETEVDDAETPAEPDVDAAEEPEVESDTEAEPDTEAESGAGEVESDQHEFTVPWDEIRAIRALRGLGRTRLAIAPHDTSAALARLVGGERRTAAWNIRVHAAAYVVDVTGSSTPRREIFDAVTSCSRGRLALTAPPSGRWRRAVRRAFNPSAP